MKDPWAEIDLEPIVLDLSKIEMDDVEDFVKSLSEEEVIELDVKLKAIQDRLTKRERVIASAVEVIKTLIKIGAKVI